MGLASLLISLLIFSAAISHLDISEEGYFITSFVNELWRTSLFFD
jgi:hypothetical protein